MPLGNLSQSPGAGKRPEQLLDFYSSFYPPLSLTLHLSGGERWLLCILRKVITLSEIKEKNRKSVAKQSVVALGFSTDFFFFFFAALWAGDVVLWLQLPYVHLILYIPIQRRGEWTVDKSWSHLNDPELPECNCDISSVEKKKGGGGAAMVNLFFSSSA